MDAVADYILTLIGGSLICSVILSLSSNGKFEKQMKLLCGMFMTVSLLHPLPKLDFADIRSALATAELGQGDAIAAMGENFSRDLIRQRIKETAEEYILDKAAACGMTLAAEVTVSDSDAPVPTAVILSGKVSREERIQLEQMIIQDLDISKENLQWTEVMSGKE